MGADEPKPGGGSSVEALGLEPRAGRRRGGGATGREPPTASRRGARREWRRREAAPGSDGGVDGAGARRHEATATASGGCGGAGARRHQATAPINKSFFMLVGIKLSNLSGEQKNLKDKRKFFNQICRVPYLQHSAKETLPSALSPALGKITPLPSARWWHSANT